MSSAVSALDWEIAERLGCSLAEVCRLHPVERHQLWPARIAAAPPVRGELVRVQILLAHLCAMLGSVFRARGEPPSTLHDFAPWLPRPEAAQGEGVEGEGLATLMGRAWMERVGGGEG